MESLLVDIFAGAAAEFFVALYQIVPSFLSSSSPSPAAAPWCYEYHFRATSATRLYDMPQDVKRTEGQAVNWELRCANFENYFLLKDMFAPAILFLILLNSQFMA